jgi:mono/diheme cytochrome c family protein
VILALLALGCAPAPRWSTDLAPLLDAECAACHGPEEPEAGLDLWTDPVAATVAVPSTQAPMDLVTPGEALYSYLFHKVNGTHALAGGSGTQMPVGPALSPEQIDAIAAWIDGGARW